MYIHTYTHTHTHIHRLHCEACGFFVPRPGIEPVSPAVAAWSPNHWTTREIPPDFYNYTSSGIMRQEH